MASMLLHLAMFYTSTIAGIKGAQPCSRYLNGHPGTFHKAVSENDVIFTSDIIQETSVRSKVDCGRRCARDDQCVMYTFWKSTWRCRLYGKIQNENGNQESAPAGAVSYVRNITGYLHNGYTLYDGRCIKVLGEALNYKYATDRCNMSDGGHLLYTKNTADLQFAQKIMKEKSLDSLWVGADDLEAEGQYKWADGAVLQTEGDLWYIGSGESKKSSEDCVGFQNPNNKLYEENCSREYYVVCQRDVD